MERVGKNRRGDLCQTGTGKSEMKGLQDDSESSYVTWVGDGGIKQKTGGGDKDVKICIGSDQAGQD